MSLSLIICTAFTACTDETDGGRDAGLGDHRVRFAVSTGDTDARTRADGGRSAAATQYLDPVELQGKLGGKSLFLQAEVTDGFPGEEQPMTRGTQIDKENKDTEMKSFAVSAYSDAAGKPDYMYNMETTKESSAWIPKEEITWPDSKKLSFYAWHPYGADGLTVTDKDTEGAPTLIYTIPETVSEQLDLMTAVNIDQSETSTVPLSFKHVLAAVKFVASADFPACTVKSVSLKGVKDKGLYTCPSDGTVTDWKLEDGTNDFTQTFKDGKVLDGTTETAITDAGETFFMLPQTFDDETARLEITVDYNGNVQTVGTALKNVVSAWTAGKTYTIRISSGSFNVELMRTSFAATGKDAVVYVKAMDGWTAELVEDTASILNTIMTFAAGQNGEADNSGSSDNAKLVFGTIGQSSLKGEKYSVKVRFTPKNSILKPVDKTVTFWKALEVEDEFYAVSDPSELTLLQITNGDQCPTGFMLPDATIAKAISNLDTESEVAYEKTYPTLDMNNSFGSCDADDWAYTGVFTFKTAELDHIKIVSCGEVNTKLSNLRYYDMVNVRAKYSYYKGGIQEEKGNLAVGGAGVQTGAKRDTVVGKYAIGAFFMYKNADNLLKDHSYFGIDNSTDNVDSAMKVFDTESYDNTKALSFLLNNDQTITDWAMAEDHSGFQTAAKNSIDPLTFVKNSEADDKTKALVGLICVFPKGGNGAIEYLTGANIISPTATTYYVRKLADDE